MIGIQALDGVDERGMEAHVVLPASDERALDTEKSLQREVQQLAAINALVALVASEATPAKACRVLAIELQQLTQAQLVTLALCGRRKGVYEVVATSDREHLDPKSELAQALTSASQECATREAPAHWPPREAQNRHALLAHRRLSNLMGTRSLYSLPLPDSHGNFRGICIIVGAGELAVTPEHQQMLDAASVPLGASLCLVQRARGNRFDRATGKLTEFLSRKYSYVILAVMALILALAWLPMRYQVKCDCELQPVVRRFIAAPFDARLEKSFVAPGDVVAEGELLARIDAQDIQWKLSAKQAEAQRVETELAGYVASHESGKAQIAQLELERIQVELDELDYQAEHLEIRSPLSGMVLLGDHAKLEGVPLERGKTLFEVAPLEQLVIEVEVAQDDVRFVEPGQLAKIRFDAFPLQPISGRIERVHPRAENREDKNVFVAEIVCENTDQRLRPGMSGVARINTVFRPVVWNYFHKPFAKALIWLGI